MNLHEQNNFDERLNRSSKIRSKYTNYVPIIIQEDHNKHQKVCLSKTKYIVPSDFTLSQFIYILRKNIKISPEESIFCFIDKTIPNCSETIDIIDKKFKDKDGFLYMTIVKENTFGFQI